MRYSVVSYRFAVLLFNTDVFVFQNACIVNNVALWSGALVHNVCQDMHTATALASVIDASRFIVLHGDRFPSL